MFRSPASRKRILALALAVSAGTGIGVGTATLWSAAGATTPQVYRADAAVVPAADGGTTAAPSAPLTLEDAKAVAARTAPGQVIGWDQDQEPTGLQYEVTMLHDDGTTTEVEVDSATGQVTSIDHDSDRD